MPENMLQGVIAASITPIKPDLSPDLSAIPVYLDFLAARGCHGALLLGTTGEGPSFSVSQRIQIFKAAREFRKIRPDFTLLAGTGTPNLEETIRLCKSAFENEFDGVVVLPPYYFKNVSSDGLFRWYETIVKKSIPSGGNLLGYHIPQISGVPLPIDLLDKLMTHFPNRFTGIKDSSGSQEFAQTLGKKFGRELMVFTGNDRLLDFALSQSAAGCITSLANLASPISRTIWDLHQADEPTQPVQLKLSALRAVLDDFPPAPSFLKAVLNTFFDFPHWDVMPPLIDLPAVKIREALQMLEPLLTESALLPS
jgi:4-hydroxy-tetrahydrodipicolinate synthase